MNIYQKLIEVRKSCKYLKKENKGNQYQYVSSSQTLAALKEKLDEFELLLIPSVTEAKVRSESVEFTQNNKPKRTTTYFTELHMVMTWVNAENPEEKIVCPWYGQGVDIAGEKGVGKAMTYAEKYFMLKFFNIPTDKDDPDSFQKKVNDSKPVQNEPPALLSEECMNTFKELVATTDTDMEGVFKNLGVNSFDEIRYTPQYKTILDVIKKRPKLENVA